MKGTLNVGWSAMDIDSLIVVIYLGIIMVVGLMCGRGIHSFKEYAVARQSYSAFVIFATLSASFIGGGFTMGNAEKVFLFGMVSSFALCGFSLKEFVVSKWIAPRMASFRDAISVGDIMRPTYGKKGQILTGIFSVLVCTGIVGAQVGAIGYVFEVLLGISQSTGVLIGCSIVIAYVTVGGIHAVVLTDVVQFVLIAVGFILAVVFGLEAAGGWSNIQATVPAEHLTFFGDYSPWAFLALFLTFFFGEALVPPYLQRLLIGRTPQVAATGTLWSAIFSVPFFLMTGVLGLVALTLHPTLNPNLAIPYVIQTVLPIGIKGLVIASIISVVMSSADSFLNSASVALTHDVINPLRKKPFSDKTNLMMGKVFSALIGVMAIIFALMIKSVLDILVIAYNFWAPTILVPLVAAVFGVRSNFTTLLVSASTGIAAALTWHYAGWFNIDGTVTGLCANLIAFCIMTFVFNSSRQAVILPSS